MSLYTTVEAAVAALEKTHGPRAAMWAYHAATGEPVGAVVRWNTPTGKTIRPLAKTLGGWAVGAMPEPRALYQLPALAARGDDVVYVAEGEKCADALAVLGYLATTSCGGASAAAKADWSPLAGRNVVIVPDADAAGAKYAADVSAALAALTPPATVRLIDLRDAWPDLGEGGDIADVAEREDAESVRGKLAGLVEAEGEPTGEWPDISPLPSGLPPVEAFSYDMLPESLRPWVRDIAERMQCPPELPAVFMLAGAGSLLGRKVAIRPKRFDDWTEVANMWALGIGAPSMMKSPARREALRTVYHLQSDARREHAIAMMEFDVLAMLDEANEKAGKANLHALAKAGKKEEAETLAASMVSAATTKRHKPSEKVYVTSDCTVEALGVILGDNPDGVLIDRDEIIGWLKALDQQGHENDRGFYLAAWAGLDSYEYRRIGRGTTFIESACVSLVGTIQPGVYAEYIKGAVAGGVGADGLSQRFQLAVWPDNPPAWKNVDRYPDKAAKDAAHAALEWLAVLTPADAGAEIDEYGKIPFLRFDSEAQKVFDQWHERLVTHCRAGVEHPAMESHLLKQKSTVAALALIFHLLDGGIGPVAKPAIDRAVAWARFLASHARRIYGVVSCGGAMAARALAKRVETGDVKDGFTARDVYNSGWAGLDREATYAALDILVGAGWLVEAVEETGGRPKTRYSINPKIMKYLGDGTSKTSKSPPVPPFDPFDGSPTEVNRKIADSDAPPEWYCAQSGEPEKGVTL